MLDLTALPNVFEYPLLTLIVVNIAVFTARRVLALWRDVRRGKFS